MSLDVFVQNGNFSPRSIDAIRTHPCYLCKFSKPEDYVLWRGGLGPVCIDCMRDLIYFIHNIAVEYGGPDGLTSERLDRGISIRFRTVTIQSPYTLSYIDRYVKMCGRAVEAQLRKELMKWDRVV